MNSSWTEHRNSRTIHNQLPKAESVPREEIHRFREHTQILLTQLENYMGDTQKLPITSLPINGLQHLYRINIRHQHGWCGLRTGGF